MIGCDVFVYFVGRMTLGVGGDCHARSRMILILFDPGAIDSMMRDFIPDPIAAIVRPDGGSHQRIETESSEMYREIERCAAEMLLAFDQVPQDGTEAEGFTRGRDCPGGAGSCQESRSSGIRLCSWGWATPS